MNTRVSKLNSEFKRMIAEVLTKKVKDPRITEMFTVLDVDCDKELSTAKVYVSVFSTDAMHIRKVPEFSFILDTSQEYGQKIDKILNEINQKSNNS